MSAVFVKDAGVYYPANISPIYVKMNGVYVPATTLQVKMNGAYVSGAIVNPGP